jgi:phage terminase large subunit
MATLNPNLKDFWIDDKGELIKSRNLVLYGGRASSKSWEFCGRLAQIGQEFKTRVLCVRRFQNKIKDSVYTLLKDQIDNFDFGGYTVLANSITNTNGTEIVFYGIERNITEIKSFEGADIMYIEEAQDLTKEQWEILDPTIRKEGSEIWISFNPKLITDFIYQRFIVNPPINTRVRMINYLDNPFLSKTARRNIEAIKIEDEDQHAHIYLGQPLSDDDQAVIKRSWVEAAIDAHLKLDVDLNGANTVGYDVADSGDDKNAIAGFNGAICECIEEWKAPEDELNKSATRAHKHVRPNGLLVYDSIGVGAHTGSTLKREGHKNHTKFNAAGGVFNPDKYYAPKIKNKDKFENLKAQAWQDVADRLRNTFNAVNKGMKYSASELISISSEIKNIEGLKTELCSPHKDYSKRGLDMVESKKDMAKRGIKSPNKADAFIMGACPHLSKAPSKRLNID